MVGLQFLPMEFGECKCSCFLLQSARSLQVFVPVILLKTNSLKFHLSEKEIFTSGGAEMLAKGSLQEIPFDLL